MSTQPKKILLVDDEADILEFLSYQLKKKGFDVWAESNGFSALQKAYEIIPDLIITDLRMPQMDGIEMCRLLKSDDLLKNIPVLFLTADDGEYVAMLAHKSGADFYLNKPVKPSIVMQIVDSMMDSVQLS